MQDPRHQVFVSSTYVDLIEERRQVTEQLLRSRCIPAGMELFTASALPPWQEITSVLDGTDYMVLILAGTYGSVGSDGCSFTERGYDYAQTWDIPVLPFLHEAPGALPADRVDSGKAAKKLDAFRQKVSDSERHTVQFWSDARDLAQKVGTAIHEAIRRQSRPGWVRRDADYADDQRLAARTGSAPFADGPPWASPFATPGDIAPGRTLAPSYVPGAMAQVLASTYYPEPAFQITHVGAVDTDCDSTIWCVSQALAFDEDCRARAPPGGAGPHSSSGSAYSVILRAAARSDSSGASMIHAPPRNFKADVECFRHLLVTAASASEAEGRGGWHKQFGTQLLSLCFLFAISHPASPLVYQPGIKDVL